MTEADLAADALLKRRLGEAFPEAGWLSEETADDADRLERRMLVVVDPIDGTRAFVAGDPRWAVSVGAGGRRPAGRGRRPCAGARTRLMPPRAARAPRSTARRSRSRRLSIRAASAPPAPKPILQAMGARLGATVEIAPRVPSLAYRLCMAARGAIHFAVAAGKFARLGHRRRRSPARGGRRAARRRLGRTADLQPPAYPAAAPCSRRPSALAPRLLEAFRAATGAGA